MSWRSPDDLRTLVGQCLAGDQSAMLALVELRAEYRQSFLLFHDHELSYGEIAEAMGVPLGTIKTWVHRARRELIQHLRRRGAISEERQTLSISDALSRV